MTWWHCAALGLIYGGISVLAGLAISEVFFNRYDGDGS